MHHVAAHRPLAVLGTVAAAATAGLLLILTPFASAMGWLLLATFVLLAWRQLLFSVWGFACIAAVYYWIGIVNPFNADIHGVLIDRGLAQRLVWIVVAGLISLLVSAAVAGREAARRPSVEGPINFDRLYRAAAVCLALGLIAVIGVYLRFGTPALEPVPDIAREEINIVLSPYTQYQWLLIDIGVCLTAIGVARDVEPSRARARITLVLLSLVAGGFLALYASRILVAAPFVAGAIAWTTQGRRIPPRVMAIGVAAALAVVSIGWLARLSAFGAFTLYNVDFDLGSGLAAGMISLAAAVTIFARTSIEIFALFVAGRLPKLGGEIALMSVIALLPGHQRELGLFRVTQMLGYEGATGTTISLFGGMYADFGIVGVVVESALIGAMLGFLDRRARMGDGLASVFYAISFTYYVATIYGGVLLDVTLLWKLWIAGLVVRYVRGGRTFDGGMGVFALATVALYLFGIAHLLF
jgi:hypothetical protein